MKVQNKILSLVLIIFGIVLGISLVLVVKSVNANSSLKLTELRVTGGGGYIDPGDAGANALLVPQGFIGIGYGETGATPQAPLDVNGWTRTSGLRANTAILDNTLSVGTTHLPTNAVITANGGVVVGTYSGVSSAPANGLIVSGYVGIGTSTPSYNLDLTGIMAVRAATAEIDLIPNTGLQVAKIIFGDPAQNSPFSPYISGLVVDSTHSNLTLYAQGLVQVGGNGFKILAGSAKPTCDSSTRGTLWFQPKADANTTGQDHLQICIRGAGTTYGWNNVF